MQPAVRVGYFSHFLIHVVILHITTFTYSLSATLVHGHNTAPVYVLSQETRRMTEVKAQTATPEADTTMSQEYLKIKNQTTTLRHGPFIAGVCSAIGFTASTITWYRFTACRFHGLTMAFFVVPNAGIMYCFTKFVHKHEVTLPTTSGKLSDDQASLLSTKIQLLYGSVIPVITASYPFIGSNWAKGRKAGLTFSKHVGIQMKNFLGGFSLRKSNRYYRLLLINVILQCGVGALLGYNQVVERNLVKNRVFKDNEILPEYEDLFLQRTTFHSLKTTYEYVVDTAKYNIESLFPPAK